MKKLLLPILIIIFLTGCSIDNDPQVQNIDDPDYRNFKTRSLDYTLVFDPVWWTSSPFDHSDYQVFNTQDAYFDYISSLSLTTSNASILYNLPIDFNRETAILLYDITRHHTCGDRFWIAGATEYRNEIEITIGRIYDCNGGFFAAPEKPILIITTPKTYKPVSFIEP